MALITLIVILLSLYPGASRGDELPPCNPTLQQPYMQQQDKYRDPLEKIYVQCGSMGCIRERFIKLIDDYDTQSSVPLLGGLLSVERRRSQRGGSDGGGDVGHLGEISARVDRYLRSHSVRVHLPTATANGAPRRHVELGLGLLAPPQARSNKFRRFLLPLMLALQVKMIFALPLFLLVSLALGLKSFTTSIMAMVFSGAALIRSLFSGGRGGGGASSRVSYEVKQPPVAAATFNSPLTPDSLYPYQQYYPPTTALAARAPEYKIFSAASNERRKK